ncbi:MAG: sulfur-oxidizing protein SoxX [Planctomycetota bacterium]|jgi:sulfur-oxidizing protein SoxX
MSFRQSSIATLCSLFLLFFMSACETERTSGKGLVLPEGSVESGKASFVDLGCTQCHSVAGVNSLKYEGETKPMLLLGGKVGKVKTYGELVTSVVNPDHVISPVYLKKLRSNESEGDITTPMPSFNDEMTVAQLIDLVTFLDAQYEILIPEYVSHRHGYGYMR